MFLCFACLFYNNSSLYYVQQKHIAQLVAKRWNVPQDLGSNLRFPLCLHIIFLFRFRCAPKTKVHHGTFSSSLPHVLRSKSDVHPGRSIISQVKCKACDQGSQRGLPPFGPRILILTPPFLLRPNLFLYSFLFVSFNLFIYLLTNLIIFFL